jgi:hypothetical protein
MFNNIKLDCEEDEKQEKDDKKEAPMLQNEILNSRTIIISEEVSPEFSWWLCRFWLCHL